MNLLAETIKDITTHGHTIADVAYIGSRDGYACTWDEFTVLADRDYDNGYGGQEVACDLEIHFDGGEWLERYQYDGAEDWVYREPFVLPQETKPVHRLINDEGNGSAWLGLAELQKSDDE